MKKFLVMLAIMAIAIGAVGAATGQYVVDKLTNSDTDRAALEVTLDLSGESALANHYQIGFTGEDVTGKGVTDLASITAVDTIALDTATPAGEITHNGDLYV